MGRRERGRGWFEEDRKRESERERESERAREREREREREGGFLRTEKELYEIHIFCAIHNTDLKTSIHSMHKNEGKFIGSAQ